MKQITDRLRMIVLGLFVLIVGVFSPSLVMKTIGEVMADKEYDPIKIRDRHRKEFLANYRR